jgi:hypothetical protein
MDNKKPALAACQNGLVTSGTLLPARAIALLAAWYWAGFTILISTGGCAGWIVPARDSADDLFESFAASPYPFFTFR